MDETRELTRADWDYMALRAKSWQTLPEFLRSVAAEGVERKSFAGRERLVAMLMRDAADALAPEHPNYREQYQRTGDQTA